MFRFINFQEHTPKRDVTERNGTKSQTKKVCATKVICHDCLWRGRTLCKLPTPPQLVYPPSHRLVISYQDSEQEVRANNISYLAGNKWS